LLSTGKDEIDVCMSRPAQWVTRFTRCQPKTAKTC